MYLVPSLGGFTKKIAENGFIPQWRPDGERIAYLRRRTTSESGKLEFWTVRPDGSDNRLEFVDSVNVTMGGNLFSWSPDGKEIA